MYFGKMFHHTKNGFLWLILGPVLSILVLAWSSPVFSQSLAGSYLLIGDSDGTVPKKEAVITLTVEGTHEGTLFVKATQPGQTLEDTGTYVVADNVITLRFKELEWRVENQPYTFDGCTLVLPLKALSGSPGPGTSTWVKKDPACNEQRIAALEQAQTSDQEPKASGSESEPPPSKNGGSSGGSPAPSPTNGDEESCEQCKYIPCLKSIIKQKEEIVAALNTLRAQRDWDSDGTLKDNFYCLTKKQSQEDKKLLIKWSNVSRKNLWDDVYSLLNPETAQEITEHCNMSDMQEVTMLTHPLDCSIDEESRQAVKDSMPCKELYDISYEHEKYHRKKCLARREKNPECIALFSARGEAKEEVEAYSLSISLLKELLKKAESKCLWLCRCNQERYESAEDCDKYCPPARLGKCHAPTCVELDPETRKWIPGKGRAF